MKLACGCINTDGSLCLRTATRWVSIETVHVPTCDFHFEQPANFIPIPAVMGNVVPLPPDPTEPV